MSLLINILNTRILAKQNECTIIIIVGVWSASRFEEGVLLNRGGGYPRREFVTLVTSKNLVAALLLRGD